MTLIADIFSGDAFSAVELTAAVNVVPNSYGRLNELNLFPPVPVASTKVALQFENGSLNLLPTRARGGPPSLGRPTQRSARVFSAFHIPHDDFVSGEDLPFLVGGGSGTATTAQIDTVQSVVNRKLATMRAKHAQTLEHLRMGALKGQLLDYDGSTLLNLFTEFGVTEKVVNFQLTTGATNVPGKIKEVTSYIEDSLQGDTMTGVHCLASPEWMDSFLSHATVREAFNFYTAGPNPQRDNVSRAFPFQGVMFEEHRGTANQLNEDGTFTARRFIPANEARFFPVGTTDSFATYFAPGDFIDTVGQLGEEVYARQAIDPEFQRWVKLHTQSNPLPIVKRPALLVRGTRS